MEANELLKFVITKLFNKTDDEVTALLMEGDKIKDGAGDALLALDQARITRIKEGEKAQGQTMFDNGYKKAQKEVLTGFEKTFKEKTGFESDLTGVDLVLAWGDTQKKVKIDDVKLHPEYLSLEKRLKAAQDEWEGKVQKLQQEYEAQRKRGAIKERAWKVLNAGEQKPVIPKNPVVAANIEKVFMSQFDGFDYQTAADGSDVVIKDGKRVEDAHGNLITFENFVRGIGEQYYEFTKQDDRGNAGNAGSGGVGGGGGHNPQADNMG